MIGKEGHSAVATRVERVSRFLILVPLTGRGALTVGDAVIAATGGLPSANRLILHLPRRWSWEPALAAPFRTALHDPLPTAA